MSRSRQRPILSCHKFSNEIRKFAAVGVQITKILINPEFVEEFNDKEILGVTEVLVPCITKLGQNVFTDETEPFTKWLESLTENALYYALLNAHLAMDLEVSLYGFHYFSHW